MQTLTLIDIRNIVSRGDRLEIKIVERVKTSAINRAQPLLILPFFKEDPLICPAITITDYIERTKELRGMENRLLVSVKKPHKAVSAETLSHWIKKTLQDSGINVSYFKAYVHH
ncbi:hypothetical protein KPH14_008486 [Odynerus spinipes]|uniref:Uncharacterized protein n=1 Tax=Odynerus spinipes TaxID=1348599 RepID=A0AAD9RWK1_9HYME|nr:hypothetical protein KPH14_008486 [Odynerus spinipes]